MDENKEQQPNLEEEKDLAENKEKEPARPVIPDPKMYGWKLPPVPPQYPQYNVPPQQPFYSGNPYNPGFGGNGNPYPQYGYMPPYPPYGYAPPKKKMAKGLKALFIGIGSLFGVLLIALIVFGAIHFSQNGLPQENQIENLLPEFPYSSEAEGEKAETEEKEEAPIYEIEPNHDGLKIEDLPRGAELSAKEIYAKISMSVVSIKAENATAGLSLGSGIIATEDGYVITNAHVILNSRSTDVTVSLNDKREYKAVVVGFDKTTDLAVIKIVDTEDEFLPATFGDSDQLAIGEWVLAIGSPGGSESSTLTRGIVSAVERTVGSNSEKGMKYIQTDAAINPGNSGGALVNMHGQVIGINSAKIIATGYEGMGFAIPTTKAKAIIDDLMAGGYVKGRARLGIRGYDVDTYTAFYNDVPMGFQIAAIDEDSAFAGTEAQVGDIITAIDDEKVSALEDISVILSAYTPGDQAKVTLYRPGDRKGKGTTFDVTITFLEDKGETQG